MVDRDWIMIPGVPDCGCLGHAGGAAGVDVEDGIVVAGELLCERLGGHGGEDGGEAGDLGLVL